MSKDATTVFLANLSKRLAQLRRRANMTQEKLAEEANIDRVALANIETGRRHPTVTTVHKIARALNIKIEEVFKDL